MSLHGTEITVSSLKDFQSASKARKYAEGVNREISLLSSVVFGFL